MSVEPDVRSTGDVIPWIAAHRARSSERWDNQKAHNEHCLEHTKLVDDRLVCLERKVIRWSTIAALVGAMLGAVGMQLFRHYLLTGAS